MKSTNPIAALFARSPFKPMQEHMAVVVDCVSEVPPLFEALANADRDGIERIAEQIFTKEGEADAIKNQVRLHLPKGLFMPVDRRDLLAVLEVQDAIADGAQDIAGLLLQREMAIPESMQADLQGLVEACVSACHQASAVIGELDELLETGFRGPEASRVESMIEGLNAAESETDKLGIALTKALFEQEDDMNPVSVLCWYRLIEWIGRLADNAEKVGDRVLLLIAR